MAKFIASNIAKTYDLARKESAGGATITLDLAQAQTFNHAVTEDTTFEFANEHDTNRTTPVLLYLKDPSLGSRVINYPTGTKFGDEGTPNLSGKTYTLILFVWAGDHWFGSYGGGGSD